MRIDVNRFVVRNPNQKRLREMKVLKWYEIKCPNCGSTNVSLTAQDTGSLVFHECEDCGCTWCK